MVDLQSYTRDELEELRARIDKRMVELEKESRVAAVNELKEVAKRHGLSMDEMMQIASSGGSAGGAVAKFRDPENPDNTWTGRGRKPKWLVAALDGGAELESFAI